MIAADLFCGAGGSSSGLLQAFSDVQLIAINHWQLAIETHTLNHPGVTHYNSDLEDIDPKVLFPLGKLDLMVASPACTHFSRARGGKPMSKQSRASIKYVLRWIRALDVQRVLIENVPDFMSWGPLDKETLRPVPERKGEYFTRFIMKLKKLGYMVDWKVLVSADYGDPTTRQRLYIQARKDKFPTWPEPTHSKTGEKELFGNKKPWVPARDVIDWTLKGESIYLRKKPLAENTMKRIEAGLRKYGGIPFVIGQQSAASPRNVSEPIPTVASAGAISMVQPFIVQMDMGGRLQPVSEPMNTVTSGDARAIVEPYLVMLYGQNNARSVDRPIPTITSGGEHIALARPFLVEYHSNGDARSIEEPLPTITTKDRVGIAEPIIFEQNGQRYMLDILFRMLQPHELAAAMGFPKSYKFAGNREQKVKQIGNAVTVNTAAVLCKEIMS